MAIVDKFLQLSDAQVVTATAPSTNVIDAGPLKGTPSTIFRDLGAGEQLYLEVSVAVAATGTAATIQVSLQDSADNSTFADVLLSPAIAQAALVVGKRIYIPLPPGLRRYIRANYTAGGTLTSLTLNAQVVDGANYHPAYPDLL